MCKLGYQILFLQNTLVKIKNITILKDKIRWKKDKQGGTTLYKKGAPDTLQMGSNCTEKTLISLSDACVDIQARSLTLNSIMASQFCKISE